MGSSPRPATLTMKACRPSAGGFEDGGLKTTASEYIKARLAIEDDERSGVMCEQSNDRRRTSASSGKPGGSLCRVLSLLVRPVPLFLSHATADGSQSSLLSFYKHFNLSLRRRNSSSASALLHLTHTHARTKLELDVADRNVHTTKCTLASTGDCRHKRKKKTAANENIQLGRGGHNNQPSGGEY